MGYCASINEADWVIPTDKADEATEALRKVSTRWTQQAEGDSLKEILYSHGYDCEKTEEGFSIQGYEMEKIGGDEVKVFNAMAPFVKEGSYVQWHGEEGDLWRHVARGGKAEEVYPEIEWG